MSLTDDLSDAFFEGTTALCDRLRMDPLDLLSVMMALSAARSAAADPASDASGLLRFAPTTLAELGWTGTPEEFRRLSAEQQLPFVEAYFQPLVYAGLDTAARICQALFLPSSLPLNSDSETVLAAKDGPNAEAYARDRDLDADFDGTIRIRDFQQAIERRYASPRWQEIVRRLSAATAGPAGASTANVPQSPELDLRTPEGIAGALEALGFDRRHYAIEGAIRAFQLRSGLPADGKATPAMRSAVRSALDEKGVPYAN